MAKRKKTIDSLESIKAVLTEAMYVRQKRHAELVAGKYIRTASYVAEEIEALRKAKEALEVISVEIYSGI